MLLPTVLDAPARRLSATAQSYVRLTKPRVVELLLVTAVPPMVLAARGWPALRLVVAVLVGGALAAGGANAINCWIERDRDQVMRRTHNRPLPAGEIDPTSALVFGIALNVVAFVFLTAETNLLAACLTLAATLFYVFVYTIWLKPRTVQNIVIGGAAGAVPALVGWAAVTDRVSAPAWVLFLVVFCWTPAHFWALALKYREDYAAAGIPMLPVVRGVAATTRGILRYAVLTVAVTLTLGLFTDVGAIYLGVAGLAGLVFIGAAVQLVRDGDPKRAIRFFGWSNLYLMLVFVAVAADTLVFR
ncbi:MAG: heme o synthase [Actinomycetota bacterium]|jgi:protoheme IX farnesyltransferase|nr:heme o synthase [Actinomycetota bacterium]